jgi:hypothetical protein
MDVAHVLYNTIGSDFESFLEPADLLTMRAVSSTTREGPLAQRFNLILNYLMRFKNIDLLGYPLRYYAKKSKFSIKELYDVCELLWNAKRIDSFTMMILHTEPNTDRTNKLFHGMYLDLKFMVKYILERKNTTKDVILMELEKAGYNIELLLSSLKYFTSLTPYYSDKSHKFGYEINKLLVNVEEELKEQLSYRFNYELLKGYTFDAKSINTLYLLDSNVRSVIFDRCTIYNLPLRLNYRELNTTNIFDYPKDVGGAALTIVDPLQKLTNLAVKFKDYDLYVEYFSQYFNEVPIDDLKKLFETEHYIGEDDIVELYHKSQGYKHVV